jgi:outer membrane protein assembly factor BamB
MIGALLLAPSQQVTASAGLSMTGFTPAFGPVGTLVTITGTGFAARDVVAFNGTQASGVTTNSAGTKLRASIPAFATSGPITVTDPPTGQTVGMPGTTFQVTTGLFAWPKRLWAGQQLTLKGSGLSPDRRDIIEIGRKFVGAALTDANGNFQVEVSVPWDAPAGKNRISVIDVLGVIRATIFLFGYWPAYRHDASLAGLNTAETALSVSSVPSVTTKWATPVGSRLGLSPNAPPIVAGGMVYFGAPVCGVFQKCHWELEAADASTGSLIWTWDHMDGLPAEAGGTVFVPSGSNGMVALNAYTGALEWSQPATGIGNVGVPSGSRLYVCAGNTVYALSESTGAVAWSRAYTNPSVSTVPYCSAPAVAAGTVFVSYTGRIPSGGGAGFSSVYALSASSGKQLWERDYDNPTVAQITAPAFSAGNLYFSGTVLVGPLANTYEYALSASTGTPLWTTVVHSSNTAVSPSGIAGNTVFMVADGWVTALDTATGSIIWEAVIAGGCMPTAVAVANGVVYGGTCDGHLYALNASNGNHLLDVFGLAGGRPSDPVVANGMIYIDFPPPNVTGDGIFAAFGI